MITVGDVRDALSHLDANIPVTTTCLFANVYLGHISSIKLGQISSGAVVVFDVGKNAGAINDYDDNLTNVEDLLKS